MRHLVFMGQRHQKSLVHPRGDPGADLGRGGMIMCLVWPGRTLVFLWRSWVGRPGYLCLDRPNSDKGWTVDGWISGKHFLCSEGSPKPA